MNQIRNVSFVHILCAGLCGWFSWFKYLLSALLRALNNCRATFCANVPASGKENASVTIFCHHILSFVYSSFNAVTLLVG